MRSWSPNIQLQCVILSLVILTFVFLVASHAEARTSNTVTLTSTTAIANGMQSVSTSSAVAAPVISFATGFAGSQSKVILKGGDAQLGGSAIQSSQIIDCPSGFASTGACGVGIIAGGKSFQLNGSTSGTSPALSGSRVLLIPTGATHAALSFNYQTHVNVQAFTASFMFVPNGQNLAFVIQNSNNNPNFNGSVFSAGAGCEAGFFQGYSQTNPPNHVFALELDSYSPLTASGSFTYSSAQIYQSGQSPCIPSIQNYPVINKIRTAPVDLTTGSQNTTTGDTYSATVTYDGTNLTLHLYNVTAGSSCPGPNCFIYTWNNVDIPARVGGNTAWVGFTAATGLTSNAPLYIESLVYTENE